MTDSQQSEPLAPASFKAAQQALAHSQALLRIASRIGRLGGWALDVASQQICWSEETSKIHELPLEAMPKLDAAIDFYVPEHRPIIRQAVQRCMREGLAFDEELRFVTATGRPLWVRVIGEACRAADGSIQRIQGAIQDITDRKAAENRLDASEKRFRQFADEMPLVMWTATPDGTIDYANRYFYEYTGLSPEQSPESRWQPAFHPDDLPRSLELWARHVKTGEPFENEVRVRRGSDGVYRWFHIQAVLTHDSVGDALKWHGSAMDIHSTKILKEEASDLAQQLQNTLESITDAFFTLDLDWRFTYLNVAAERLLKRTRDELLGRSIWEEFPPAVGSTFEREYRRAIDEGRTTSFEEFYPPLNRWFAVRAYPSSDGLSIYFEDVTQKHQDEELLRLLHSCVSVVNAFIMITEVDWDEERGPRIVYVNDAFLRHHGYRREDVIGKTSDILHGTESHRDVLEASRKAIASQQPVSKELVTHTATGAVQWRELTLVPVADDTGRLTHLMAIQRDITHRKLAEQQLRQSEERFRFLSQATSDAIWDWDLLTHQVWRSAGFETLTGYTVAETKEVFADWTQRIHPEDREQVLSELQRVLVQGGICWTAEYRFLRRDGSHADVIDRGVVIRDDQGQPIRMIGGMTDQSQRKKAEHEIRRLKDDLEARVSRRTAELEAANKELEAFSYSVSHDLLAPLRSIDSFSLIVLEDYASQLDDEGRRLLNIIRGEAQRMDQLIHDLLNFAKAGRQPIRAIPCEMTELAQAAFESIPTAERQHVKRFELGQLPLVEGDANMLRQVWTNLIANAVKFSRHQTEATIEIGGRVEQDCGTYFVKDNGAGFDPQYKQKLFKVFQRLHSEEEFEGTGVGLAIVQRIISRHGGKVWADSQPEKGATLYFSLPLKQATQP